MGIKRRAAAVDSCANVPVDPSGGPVGATLATGHARGRFACGIVEAHGG